MRDVWSIGVGWGGGSSSATINLQNQNFWNMTSQKMDRVNVKSWALALLLNISQDAWTCWQTHYLGTMSQCGTAATCFANVELLLPALPSQHHRSTSQVTAYKQQLKQTQHFCGPCTTPLGSDLGTRYVWPAHVHAQRLHSPSGDLSCSGDLSSSAQRRPWRVANSSRPRLCSWLGYLAVKTTHYVCNYWQKLSH